MPEEARVNLEIFNILGQKVATLFGSYALTRNVGNLSSGVYFCEIKTEGKKTFEKLQKLVLMK